MDLGKAEQLARTLMKEHGLTRRRWRFEFNRSKKYRGMCCFDLHVIKLSKLFVELNTEEDVRDTILHEIAHALTYKDKDERLHHGHGELWKRVANNIGCRYTSDGSSGGGVGVPFKWVGTCPACRGSIESHSRCKWSCGDCSMVYDPRFIVEWTPNPEAEMLKSGSTGTLRRGRSSSSSRINPESS
jgi:predicted SprT family Zn-dependent metalloprotease